MMPKSAMKWIKVLAIAIPFFLLGTAFEYTRNSHRKFHSSKSYSFGSETLKLSYFTEWHGLPFLDTNSSSLTISDEYGSPEVTIYEAQRIFQENYPQVNDVAIVGHSISWSDGQRSFVLSVTEDQKEREELGGDSN